MVWAAIGVGPKPRFSVPAEVGLLVGAFASVFAGVAFVAYLIPDG